MSNSQTFQCACGSTFTSSANIKRHHKLCKKANEPVSVGMSNLQLTKAISRIETKMDILLNTEQNLKSNIDITTIATQTVQPQKLQITSSKPSITFDELCIKDFATSRNAAILEEYALMGMNGIVALFNKILSKYKTIPFKYVNKPTKKTQQNEAIISVFEENISIYKNKTWQPMTRDDTNVFFYNLYVALENNYAYPMEDDDNYDETLDRFYKDLTVDNIYSNVIVEIKNELRDIIKTYG